LGYSLFACLAGALTLAGDPLRSEASKAGYPLFVNRYWLFGYLVIETLNFPTLNPA
jgi:hypothetical protein